ncbi:MAG: DUF502 domain-containing protein [Polyangiaceae bacterium]|nr:DUF502 domain-containing protein [Polyangiaceae bacterium]
MQTRRSPVKWFVDNFFKGCLVLVPLAITVYVVWVVFVTLDRLLPSPVPGLGIVLAAVAITVIGFLTGNVIGRRVVDFVEHLLEKMPIVRLVYASLKDLIGAFVGSKQSFDRPVVVKLDEAGSVGALGFVTCDQFDDPALAGQVAVYLPQSYNFAGNLLVVPKDRVIPVNADGASFVTFIVSGGVSGMQAAKKYLDETAPISRRRAGS